MQVPPGRNGKHEMDISIKRWGNGRMYHDVRSGCMRGSQQSGVRLIEGQRKIFGE